jgi:uncharacterized membrane protein
MDEDEIGAGLTPERVGFFTDAVFAIAMTLLVIEIPRPEGDEFGVGGGSSKAEVSAALWHFLAHQASAFYAYVLAFYLLWIVWRQQHALFDRLSRLSRSTVGLHFPLLLLIGFLPYVTTVVGHYISNPLAAGLFGLTLAALFLCRSAIQTQAYRDGLLRPRVDVAAFRIEMQVSWLVDAYWVLTLALVWWTPWVQIAWFLTSPVGNLVRVLLTIRARRAAQSVAQSSVAQSSVAQPSVAQSPEAN